MSMVTLLSGRGKWIVFLFSFFFPSFFLLCFLLERKFGCTFQEENIGERKKEREEKEKESIYLGLTVVSVPTHVALPAAAILKRQHGTLTPQCFVPPAGGALSSERQARGKGGGRSSEGPVGVAGSLQESTTRQEAWVSFTSRNYQLEERRGGRQSTRKSESEDEERQGTGRGRSREARDQRRSLVWESLSPQSPRRRKKKFSS